MSETDRATAKGLLPWAKNHLLVQSMGHKHIWTIIQYWDKSRTVPNTWHQWKAEPAFPCSQDLAYLISDST